MRLDVLDEYRTTQFTYHDASLQSHILEHFRTCRQQNRFIDLEVEVEGVVFPCHRILLDSFCPYFAAYFSFHETSSGGKSVEREGELERLALKYNGVSVTGFSKLLDYIYTSALEVSADDVIDVLRCADFLQFHHVVHLCSTFMQQHVTEETCLQILVLAKTHDLHDLAEKAFSFILLNLSKVFNQDEFGQLSQEILIKIISSPCLQVESEAVVIQAVVAWVSAKLRQRKPLLSDLLKHARIRCIDIQHIENMVPVSNPNLEGLGSSSVRASDDEIWKTVMQILLGRQGDVSDREECLSDKGDNLAEMPEGSLSEEGHNLLHREDDFLEQRDTVPSSSQNSFVEPNPLKAGSVQQNCSEEIQISLLPDRLTEVMVVVSRETERKHRGVIRDWSTLYFYDPESLRWEKLTRLPFEDRHFYAVTVLENLLYLTGGQNLDVHDIHCTKIVFNETWSYDPVSDTWEEQQAMMVPRYNHSSTVLQGQIYIVGGRSSASSSSLRGDGEVYNPTTKQWTIISPLRSISGIGNAALTALDGKLYLCGGTYTTMDRRSPLKHDWYTGAQVYNPKEDLWQELMPLEREITQSNIRVSSGDIITLEGFLLLMDDDVGKMHHLYNPVSNTTSNLVQAHGHHRFGGWVVYRGQIVSTGGVEDGRFGVTDMVHTWDLNQRQNSWIMATPLPQPMSHHSCVKMFLPLPRPGTVH